MSRSITKAKAITAVIAAVMCIWLAAPATSVAASGAHGFYSSRPDILTDETCW